MIRSLRLIMSLLSCMAIVTTALDTTTTTTATSSATTATKKKMTIKETIISGFQNMKNDLNTFQNLFTSNAIIKVCTENENSCKSSGLFDDIIYGTTFQNSVKVYVMEYTDLSSSNKDNTEMLLHTQQYIETYSGCNGIWSSYITFQINSKGKIQRMVIFSEKSIQALTCIQNHSIEMKKQKKTSEL